MSDLHAAIMNLPHKCPDDCMTPTERMGYGAGHRDARHAAAELASEYAASHQRLKEALRLMLDQGERCNWFADRGDEEVANEAREAIRSAP